MRSISILETKLTLILFVISCQASAQHASLLKNQGLNKLPGDPAWIAETCPMDQSTIPADFKVQRNEDGLRLAASICILGDLARHSLDPKFLLLEQDNWWGHFTSLKYSKSIDLGGLVGIQNIDFNALEATGNIGIGSPSYPTLFDKLNMSNLMVAKSLVIGPAPIHKIDLPKLMHIERFEFYGTGMRYNEQGMKFTEEVIVSAPNLSGDVTLKLEFGSHAKILCRNCRVILDE